MLWRRYQDNTAIRRTLALASQTTNVPLYSQTHPQLVLETARARRYQRPMTATVLILAKEQPGTGHDHKLLLGNQQPAAARIQTVHSVHFTFFLVGSLLRQNIRLTDLVMYDAINDRYILFLTETAKAQAREAVQRLLWLLGKRTQLHWHAGSAEFPTDSLTIEELVSEAQSACSPCSTFEPSASSHVTPIRRRL